MRALAFLGSAGSSISYGSRHHSILRICQTELRCIGLRETATNHYPLAASAMLACDLVHSVQGRHSVEAGHSYAAVGPDCNADCLPRLADAP